MEYFSSVNFENRQKVRDFEEMSTKFSLENEAMKRDQDARPATLDSHTYMHTYIHAYIHTCTLCVLYEEENTCLSALVYSLYNDL